MARNREETSQVACGTVAAVALDCDALPHRLHLPYDSFSVQTEAQDRLLYDKRISSGLTDDSRKRKR